MLTRSIWALRHFIWYLSAAPDGAERIPLLCAAGAGSASRFAIGIAVVTGMPIGTLKTIGNSIAKYRHQLYYDEKNRSPEQAIYALKGIFLKNLLPLHFRTFIISAKYN